MEKELEVPNFFIEMFEKFFGKKANALMSAVMFCLSSDGAELIEAIIKAFSSPKGKLFLQQVQKMKDEKNTE